MSRQTDHAAVHSMVAEYQRNSDDIILQSRIIDAFAPLTARLLCDLPRNMDREEFSQDIATELLKAAERFDPNYPNASFAKLAKTVARRVLIKRLQRHYADARRPQFATECAGEAIDVSQPSDAMEREEQQARRTIDVLQVRAMLQDHLNETEQEVLRLSMDGLSNTEIARKLNLTRKSVENSRSSIRAAVREAFGGSTHGTRSGDVGQAEAQGCCVGADALSH